MNKDNVMISGLTREYPEFSYTTNEMMSIINIMNDINGLYIVIEIAIRDTIANSVRKINMAL